LLLHVALDLWIARDLELARSDVVDVAVEAHYPKNVALRGHLVFRESDEGRVVYPVC
jgi:hypothetical protein